MAKFKKANPKNQVGRPSELNTQVFEDIRKYLRIGAYIETAVAVAGISKVTFYAWAKQANKDKKEGIETEYTEFLNAVDKAVEECVIRDLANIDKCAMGQDYEYERDENGKLILNARGNPIPKKIGLSPDWGASAWRLERRHGKQWKPTQGVEHSGAIEGGEIEDNTIRIEFVEPDKK